MQDKFKRLLCGLVAKVIVRDCKRLQQFQLYRISKNCIQKIVKFILVKFFYRQMNIFINLPWLLNSTSKIPFFHLFRTKIVFNDKNKKC